MARIEGVLLKKSYISYRPRYFELDGSNLLYKTSKEDAKERSLMSLTGDSQLIEFRAKRAFQITTGTKTWFIKIADDDKDEILFNWVSAIQGAIAHLKQGTLSPPIARSLELKHHSIAGRDFVMDSRYTELKQLGSGAYGMVVSALDTQTGKRIAIKKCANLFVDPVDARKIGREVRIMSQLAHPNIIKIVDVLPPTTADFDDVYMVGELMDVDLHRAIYYGRPLSPEHVQFFLYQILCGIKYIHSVGIVHRDLKPSNILVNSNCDLKITDFGLARRITDQTRDLTEYVVTRWYRAPEVMLSSCQYNKSVDVWSAGCIFAEMLQRKPLFPGDNYRHVLRLITKVTGSATEADLWFVSNANAKAYMLQRLPTYQRMDLRALLPNASADACTLLSRMLEFNFANRISIDEALAHPYFAEIRDPTWEMEAGPDALEWGDIDTVEPTRLAMQRIIMEDGARLNSANLSILEEIQRKCHGLSGGATTGMRAA
ncbi:mitogen-activated protein kinase [Nannochloropsis gaditana]|uniref:Mitogen-activated protein kinase n=1 Tax=Nannochloropsis gaditana TaxID=72520 RepID=W7U8Q9_9STRA|nr:mitogen-activated protein kinase [Nannochloropsis gaditana]